AKSLERIGDHAANIAEEVIFNISGQYQDLEKIRL
ncbi:MAG: phosphate transport system regulatory protein PhoU, partial [Betaproteobacteria bacterium]|nr:phosphate transport system regulatory protein PhoU [Betaproteobacteria bacterium]